MSAPPPPFVAPGPGPVRYDACTSPLGELLLTSDGEALTGLYMNAAHRAYPRVAPGWRHDPGALAQAAAQLSAYFAGELTTFRLALAPSGTAFQLRVWAALLDIAYGETASYGRVAAAIGAPRSGRAVGSANGANPISIVVPCHRVIGANGSLTGYGGGLANKELLLAHEAAHRGSALPAAPGGRA